jgi:ADP-heptose:LPS heptosyltransferase
LIQGIREEKGMTEDPEEINRFFDHATKENFDILLNFQGKGVSGIPFLKKIGATFIGGLGSDESESADSILHYYYYQPESIRFMEVATLIGASPVTLKPEIRIFEKDKKSVEQMLEKARVKKFAIFHPCGTDIRRMWSPENFSRLADKVSEKNITVIFTGTEGDKSFLKKIFSKMKSNVFDFSGKLSLGELSALFQESLFVVAIDTGPLHLAQASGANTVGLYWGPNIINWGPLTRRNHRPVINWELNCPHCGIKPMNPYPFEPVTTHCNHNHFFLDGISTSQVMKEIDYMIGNMIPHL